MLSDAHRLTCKIFRSLRAPHVHLVGQAWIIEPVAIQELIDVERKWSAASGRAHELEQQLIGLGLVPVSPRPS